jgi:16S rRNA (cytidine1402-2'-O)-methyltransferase
MSLSIVAVPIGHVKDISLRALEELRAVDVIICEEFKEASKLLKSLEITGKKLENLNEHSTPEDLQDLVKICSEQKVALISDCGTPVFCDPGAGLISECRKKNIPVTTLPGASSLMGLLSLSSDKLTQFVFRGFLPADQTERQKELLNLQKESRAIVLMDTPYRLKKILSECREYFPQRKMLLTLNLTQEDEQILEGDIQSIESRIKHEKAEFMLLLYPKEASNASAAKKNSSSRFGRTRS